MSCYNSGKEQFETDTLKQVWDIVREQMEHRDIPVPEITPDGKLSAGNLSEEQVRSFLHDALEYTSLRVGAVDAYVNTYLDGALTSLLADDRTIISESVIPLAYAIWLFFVQQAEQYGVNSRKDREMIDDNMQQVFGSLSDSVQRQITQLISTSWGPRTWLLDVTACTTDSLHKHGIQTNDIPKELREKFEGEYLPSALSN